MASEESAGPPTAAPVNALPSTGDPVDIRTRFNAVPVAAMDGIWRIENVDIPNGDALMRLRVYSANDDRDSPAVLAFHGGGWVYGDLLWMERQCRQLAASVPCRVISVDYRLAPEARFPSAAEDAYTALTYVASNADRLGIDPARIAAYGQSAGGNLVTALALMARDRGGPPLRMQIPVYPVIDADFERDSYKRLGETSGPTRAQMEWFWDLYVDPADRGNPYVSALKAETFVGVAPALVITAGEDPLQNEGEAYADRLRDDGIPVTHKMYEGMGHGFINLNYLYPQAQEAFDSVVAALRSCFGIE